MYIHGLNCDRIPTVKYIVFKFGLKLGEYF